MKQCSTADIGLGMFRHFLAKQYNSETLLYDKLERVFICLASQIIIALGGQLSYRSVIGEALQLLSEYW